METGLTDLENQIEQMEQFAAGRLIDVKIAIDSLLLKRKQQHEEVEIANEKSAKCIIPLSCRRQSSYQSL